MDAIAVKRLSGRTHSGVKKEQRRLGAAYSLREISLTGCDRSPRPPKLPNFDSNPVFLSFPPG